MVAIPFPVSSAPGARPQEGGGRLINAYAEQTAQGARAPVIWRRAPGLNRRLDIQAHAHCRGLLLVGTTLLHVLDERLYAVTEVGGVLNAVNLGALSGDDLITIAHNNAATPSIVAVTNDGVFNLYTNGAPASFADGDLPSPNSVAHLNGYLLFTTASGQIWASELNSVAVATNSFTAVQMNGGLTRGVAFRREFFAMGPQGICVYRDAGTSPFPLEFVTLIPRGLAGKFAVAGHDPGWSNELIWVGDDNRVYRLEGYAPVAISQPDLERAIEACADKSKLEAKVYMAGGNAFWSLTYRGEWTWEHNLNTGNWHERQSYLAGDWRGSCSVKAFDDWIIGDSASGKLFAIDETYYREENDPLIFTVESGIVANFPARFGSPRCDFDMTAAVGLSPGQDPIQTDPRVSIAWSNDGGYRWGNAVTRRLGREGESRQNVSVLRTGVTTAKGRRFRVSVSDPVHVALMGGQMVVEQRAE